MPVHAEAAQLSHVVTARSLYGSSAILTGGVQSATSFLEAANIANQFRREIDFLCMEHNVDPFGTSQRRSAMAAINAARLARRRKKHLSLRDAAGGGGGGPHSPNDEEIASGGEGGYRAARVGEIQAGAGRSQPRSPQAAAAESGLTVHGEDDGYRQWRANTVEQLAHSVATAHRGDHGDADMAQQQRVPSTPTSQDGARGRHPHLYVTEHERRRRTAKVASRTWGVSPHDVESTREVVRRAAVDMWSREVTTSRRLYEEAAVPAMEEADAPDVHSAPWPRSSNASLGRTASAATLHRGSSRPPWRGIYARAPTELRTVATAAGAVAIRRVYGDAAQTFANAAADGSAAIYAADPPPLDSLAPRGLAAGLTLSPSPVSRWVAAGFDGQLPLEEAWASTARVVERNGGALNDAAWVADRPLDALSSLPRRQVEWNRVVEAPVFSHEGRTADTPFHASQLASSRLMVPPSSAGGGGAAATSSSYSFASQLPMLSLLSPGTSHK